MEVYGNRDSQPCIRWEVNINVSATQNAFYGTGWMFLLMSAKNEHASKSVKNVGFTLIISPLTHSVLLINTFSVLHKYLIEHPTCDSLPVVPCVSLPDAASTEAS